MKLKRILKWTTSPILIVLLLWLFIAYWSSTNECFRNAAPPKNPMKAIVHCEYGGPDVLKLEEVEKPVPNDNQVLIKVRAASLNFIDPGLMRGPLPLRLMTGLRKPKQTQLGNDVAGQVEAVGKNVTQFKPGDEVFGVARAGLAEYACARERALVIKPANVTFEQAGSVAWAGLTALQGLRAGKIRSGQKVLINGASGGVGTFAVQIAKSFGTEVTGVCSTSKVDLIRSIGADHVIDYTKEDFTKGRSGPTRGSIVPHRRKFQSIPRIALLAAKVPNVRDDDKTGGPSRAARFDGDRKGDTRHRPDLQVERDRGGDAVSGTRTRARESRHYSRTGNKI